MRRKCVFSAESLPQRIIRSTWLTSQSQGIPVLLSVLYAQNLKAESIIPVSRGRSTLPTPPATACHTLTQPSLRTGWIGPVSPGKTHKLCLCRPQGSLAEECWPRSRVGAGVLRSEDRMALKEAIKAGIDPANVYYLRGTGVSVRICTHKWQKNQIG